MGLGLSRPSRTSSPGAGSAGRCSFESCRLPLRRPSRLAGSAAAAGTILHDWGAHLVDQALQLGLGPCRRLVAWLSPSPWEGVDSGGHGRIVLEFDDVLFQVETSRVCRIDRPRWWIVGTDGGFVKYGIDPQEDALRAGDIDRPPSRPSTRDPPSVGRSGEAVETRVPTVPPTGTAITAISPTTWQRRAAGGHRRGGPRGRPRARGRQAIGPRPHRDRGPVGCP